jgi:uncharacterized protein
MSSVAVSMKAQQEALRDGRILGFECTACKTRHLTPISRCRCGKGKVEPKEFATTGVVETFTIQFVAAEQFMNEVPFAWAIVLLDEGGPRVSGWIPFVSKPSDLAIGQRVKFTPSYKPGMMFEKA